MILKCTIIKSQLNGNRCLFLFQYIELISLRKIVLEQVRPLHWGPVDRATSGHQGDGADRVDEAPRGQQRPADKDTTELPGSCMLGGEPTRAELLTSLRRTEGISCMQAITHLKNNTELWLFWSTSSRRWGRRGPTGYHPLKRLL